jgi:hypothetical protein
VEVLDPAPVRDFLLTLATQSGLFRAKWTNEIHEEWMRNLSKNRPDLAYDKLIRAKNSMNKAVPDSLVEGYEDLLDVVKLPDENDRHVVAAAIKCQAQAIVTYNLKDFPSEALAKYGIDAKHPDEFCMDLWSLDSVAVCQSFEAVHRRLKNPPKSMVQVLETLKKAGLARITYCLQDYVVHDDGN